MVSSKLSNLQFELLELYTESVSEEELKDIKHLLSMYYAQKAIAAADRVWEEKQLSNVTMQQWMKKKMRTPYRAQADFVAKQTNK